ncbi:DUF3558 domain-containing protein [Nocardia mangyaensis]|uniref:DUF3558 domain-containing protein n=1 Tax=Nocardia mangyaensis TaxID=2213200 RepID=UPI0026749AE5|nr:DUF3558 domain-containing protein [Nocardia mangyaensis]MDO3645679.1 DUF3558 domain-containing protein [Nocardia mangyaensis]
MKRFCVAALAVGVGIVLGGCTATTDSPDTTASVTTSSAPSIAVQVSGAPTQPSQEKPAVEYDPCAALDDTAVSQAGFDPQTRARADLVFDDYAFIGCEFDRKEQVRGQTLAVGSMTVSSTNVGLDEFRQRESATAQTIQVSGRDAITYSRPADEGCFVVMTGPDATINIHVSSSLALTSWNACDHRVQIAEAIEAAVPK